MVQLPNTIVDSGISVRLATDVVSIAALLGLWTRRFVQPTVHR